MKITHSIALDFGAETIPQTIFAKQGDAQTRFVEIIPLTCGQTFTPGEGVTARLRMTKPDGHTVMTDAQIVDGKILAQLPGQALTAAGKAVAEVGLYQGEALLSSQIFFLKIERAAYSEDAVESSDEFGSLTKALARADELKAAAEAATNAAKAATDTAKNLIDDNSSGKASTWSASKIGESLNGISQSISNMGNGLSAGLTALGGRADELQHQITAIGGTINQLESGLEKATTLRGDITASGLSDLSVTQSGIYNVRITSSFSIDGSSDIQNGGGLLIVFGRNDHSALQLWLKLDSTSRNSDCKLYWRFLQTDGEEEYVLPGTKFVGI